MISTIFNISEYFRIKEYDQLYYINKDLHHSTISWVYTKKTKLFHFLVSSKTLKQH